MQGARSGGGRGRGDRRKGASAWPDTPRIPDVRSLVSADDAEEMRPEAVLEGVSLRQVQVPELAARDLVIRESEVISLGAAAGRCERSVFEDSHFSGCDLVGATLERSRWTRLALDGCRISGANLDESVLRDLAFADCQAEHLRVQGARVQRVTFVRCSLRGAYFMDATLDHVRFIDCDLREADFRHATVTAVDLRQSRLEDIGLAVDQFAGLTVTTEQALDLAIRIGGLSVDDRVVLADRR